MGTMRPKGSAEALEVRRRIGAKLFQEGKGIREVARLVGVSPSSVWRWNQALQRGGMEALKAKPHPGRRPRLRPQQKQELESQITKLKTDTLTLVQAKDSLSAEVKDLVALGAEGSKDLEKIKAERLAQLVTLYSAMKPGDAALIFDELPDDMALDLLPLLQERQAARILNGLADDKRKAQLSSLLLNRK